ARLTSSKTAAMSLPFFRVQGASAGAQKEYVRELIRHRSEFEARSAPRTAWQDGNELFNLTNAGNKATALTYSMTLADFHKLFIGRMGRAGNETEVQEVARAMAEALHARYPGHIASPETYLAMGNGAKYAPVTPADVTGLELPPGVTLVGETRL